MSLASPSLSTDLTKALAEAFPSLAKYVPRDIFEQISAPQAAFLLSDDRELLYGGSAGGGKSAALLMGALQYVDVPGYRALILRRTFAQLSKGDALIPLSQEWLAGTDAKWNEQKKAWTFPTGATLEFGHVEHENDKYDYQGAAFHYVGFDELTQFSESQYMYIVFSRQRRRTAFVDLGVPVRVRSASNPGGLGHGWVLKRFLDGVTHHDAYRSSAGAAFIPARVRDNPGLDADDYEASLAHLPEVLRQQLMDGDWGAFEGMAFPFDRQVHLVEPFEVPVEWERFESFDHGTSNPSCLLMYVVDYDGNVFVVDSHYAPGLPSSQAEAIKGMRAKWWPEGSWPVCHADPEMWATKGDRWERPGEPGSDITDYEDLGIGGFVRAKNDRSAGRTRVAEMMNPRAERYFPKQHPWHGKQGSPQLFIVGARCPELVEQVSTAPLLPLDSGKKDAGEIVDPDWEGPSGHAVAALRYGLMSRPDASSESEPWEPDMRARAVRELLEARDKPRVPDRSRYMG